jgi:hypothetical protein
MKKLSKVSNCPIFENLSSLVTLYYKIVLYFSALFQYYRLCMYIHEWTYVCPFVYVCSLLHYHTSYSFFQFFLSMYIVFSFFALIVFKNMPQLWKYIQSLNQVCSVNKPWGLLLNLATLPTPEPKRYLWRGQLRGLRWPSWRNDQGLHWT